MEDKAKGILPIVYARSTMDQMFNQQITSKLRVILILLDTALNVFLW